MQGKLFGTDGIRGIANTGLSPNLAFNVGRVLGVYYAQKCENPPRVLIGKDTRTSGDMLSCALTAGLTSMGCNVVTIGIVPTPALAYLVKKTGSDLGVMITASHNPPEFNGLKIFDNNGFKIMPNVEEELEQIFNDIHNYLPGEPGTIGRLSRDEDMLKLWADYLLQSVEQINLNGMRIQIDCANGAGYRVIPYVFKSLGATVHAQNAQNLGEKINYHCGSIFIGEFADSVAKNKCDLGFAYDGDADRVLVARGDGKILTGDEMLYIFANYMHDRGILQKDTLVTTIMTNYGIEASLEKAGIKTVRMPVGDKYVLQHMHQNGLNLGGEESGHVILGDYNMSADGLLASLYLMKILKETEKSLEELTEGIERFEQARMDIKVNERQKQAVVDGKLNDIVEELEQELMMDGRIVLRASGTECVVRILVEGKDVELIKSIAETLEDAVRNL